MGVGTALYGILGVIAFIYALDAYFCRRRHPLEPSCVRPKIPVIGHGIGLVLYVSKYYEYVSPGQPEIFALPIFTFRLNIVNSRHLFPVIMRHAKTLSFTPFTKIASRVWCNASEAFMAMHEDGHPWIRDLYRDTRTALAPGESLDYQNILTGESLQREIERLDADVGAEGRNGFAFYGWTHHLISLAATDGVYGSHNPFRDPKVEADFWLWHTGVKKLTAKMPHFFITKELQARERVFDAFERYWTSDHLDAPQLTKARKHLYDREGVSLRDQAGNQASFNLALLPNTVPTAFWSLYDIFSRLQLLADVRAEVEGNAVSIEEKDGKTAFSLDVAKLRTDCPLLLSSYQETQRTKSIHANIRQVLSETTIESPTTGSQYYMTRGEYIQMPSGPIHKDTSIWGSTASSFDPHRFLKSDTATRKGESYSFLPWGSAPHLCPARQFASTEIMLFVALMVLRFEFASPGGAERWGELKPMAGELLTMMPPKGEVRVDVRRRAGWQGKWTLVMGDSSKRIPLASG